MFQRIDVFSKDFDNIVELELGAPWPFPPVEVTATLAHKFELIGWFFLQRLANSNGFFYLFLFCMKEWFTNKYLLVMYTGSSKIKINFEKTTVKTTGNLSQLPPLEVPRIPDALRSPSNTGRGEFEVTYLDSGTRITRGDRGELRVFVTS